MTAQKNETTGSPVYSIPGFIEMEKEFDQIMITGSDSGQTQFSYDIRSKLRRNITDYADEKDNELVKLYFLSHLQAFDWSTQKPRYVPIKSLHQSDLTRTAREELETLDNKQAVRLATSILDLIEDQLPNYNYTTLPPIHAAELDNGGIIIEWIFEDFRMGFNIEMNIDKSGYFLVSKESAGEIRSSGYLKGLKLETIIQSLLTLILNNLINYG
jgi:hypothetical protein